MGVEIDEDNNPEPNLIPVLGKGYSKEALFSTLASDNRSDDDNVGYDMDSNAVQDYSENESLNSDAMGDGVSDLYDVYESSHSLSVSLVPIDVVTKRKLSYRQLTIQEKSDIVEKLFDITGQPPEFLVYEFQRLHFLYFFT